MSFPRSPSSVFSRVAILSVALSLATLAAPSEAELAVGVKAGTLGLGAEVTVDLSKRLGFRGGVAGWEEELSYTASDIDYEGDLEILDATLLLDWYPSGQGFRISLGAAWNDHRLEGRAPLEELLRQSGSFPPGTPLPNNLGTLRGEATVDELGPYLGIGFGRATAGQSRWGVSLDLGVVVHGEPEVELTADSPILNQFPQLQPIVDLLLEEEERELELEAEDWSYFPVVSFTISYRF